MTKCTACLLGLLVLTTPVQAQESRSAQPTFRAEVNLVEVVAVVTGDDEKSLGDLGAADFEVLEDGSARTLVSVRRLATDTREVTAAASARSASPGQYVERLATNATAADSPAFVLLLDDLDTNRRDAYKVIRAAEKAFTFIPDTALVSVLTTSGLGGALLTLEAPGPGHIKQIRDFRGQLLVRAIGPGGVTSTPSGLLMGGDCMTGKSSLDCQDPTRAARRASAVATAAEILGRAGSRRKVLVWVTQTMGVSTIDPHGSRAAQRRALTSALNNDITVYVLDPRENTGGADDDPDSARTGGSLQIGGTSMALDVDDMAAVPLTQLTRETGGRYITMANNLGDLLGRIIEQNSTAYLLVYESPVSRQPGRHRIDVRVKRAGARVSARRGYVVDDAEPDATAAGTRIADTVLRRTLVGSAPQGQLPLTVHVVPRFASGKAGAVVVSVLVDEGGAGLASAVDIVLATFDDDGRPTNQHQVRLDPPPAGRPLAFTTELPLARGRHQLRVAAATTDTARTGLVITPVEIIEPGRQLLMAPPVVLQQAGSQVVPTAARRFVAATHLGLQAELAGRPVQERTVTVRLSLADGTGTVLRTADAMLDSGSLPDRQRATGVLDTTGLAAGQYLLTVEAVTGRPGDAIRHAIPVQLDAAPADTRAPGALQHSVVAHGPSSRHAVPGTFVIRTEQDWRAFWSRLPTQQAAPLIDFNRVTVFAIVGVQAGTIGKPVVDAVVEERGETVVKWSAATVSQEQAAVAQPFVIVALPAKVGAVRFLPQH